MTRPFLRILALASLLLACTKTSSQAPGTFSVEGTPDEAYKKAVAWLVAQGFELESSDPRALTAQTKPKEIPITEFRRDAVLEGEIERYLRGRVSYLLHVESPNDKTMIQAQVNLEGYFTPKQAGLGGTSADTWVKVGSTGTLERDFQENLTRP